MTRTALLVGVLLTASAALAEDPPAEVNPPACEEGRPLQVRLSVKVPGERPLALVWLKARAGDASSEQSWSHRRSAVPLSPQLSPEVVTLELTASEDLSHSAVARLPRPDVRASLDGSPFVLCRLAQPGETLALTVNLVPQVGASQVSIAWKAVALDPLAEGVFARSSAYSWRPGTEPQAPGPHVGGPPRPSEDSGGIALRVQLVRWAPWKGSKAREVLIDGKLWKTLEPLQGEALASLEVTPAPFGLAAAAARAKQKADKAVRLADGRWILQRGRGWWVVPAEGELARGEGELFPFALDMARAGRAGFLWFDHHAHPELAQALLATGFGKPPGKALPVEVSAERLVEFLRLLATHGCLLNRNGIAPNR